MGYTTTFFGQFEIDRELEKNHYDYLIKFADTRRMKRNPDACQHFNDPIRLAAGLPIGIEGEFFVGGSGFMGQDNDYSIIDYNYAPKTQPGLWCKWIPSTNKKSIIWSGAEKFYDYIEWLKYIMNNFMIPWNYKVNGNVEWQGEDEDDQGTIIVNNNNVYFVTQSRGRLYFENKQISKEIYQAALKDIKKIISLI